MKDFLLAWQLASQRDCHNSGNEKPLDFELPVYSNGFLSVTTPLDFLSPVKEESSLFSGLAHGFAIGYTSQDAIIR